MSSLSKKEQNKVNFVEKPAAASPTNLNLKIGVVATIFSFVVYYVLHSDTQLPETYALCSSDGRNIYTVDNDNTIVECILVHKSHIADTGNLGKSISTIITRMESALISFLIIAVIKENAISTVGSKSFAIRYIPNGSIVIPGISGE